MRLVLVNTSCLCLFLVFAPYVLPAFAALVSSRCVFRSWIFASRISWVDYVHQSKSIIFDLCSFQAMAIIDGDPIDV